MTMADLPFQLFTLTPSLTHSHSPFFLNSPSRSCPLFQSQHSHIYPFLSLLFIPTSLIYSYLSYLYPQSRCLRDADGQSKRPTVPSSGL